jgi:hypothetical protein
MSQKQKQKSEGKQNFKPKKSEGKHKKPSSSQTQMGGKEKPSKPVGHHLKPGGTPLVNAKKTWVVDIPHLDSMIQKVVFGHSKDEEFFRRLKKVFDDYEGAQAHDFEFDGCRCHVLTDDYQLDSVILASLLARLVVLGATGFAVDMNFLVRRDPNAERIVVRVVAGFGGANMDVFALCFNKNVLIYKTQSSYSKKMASVVKSPANPTPEKQDVVPTPAPVANVPAQPEGFCPKQVQHHSVLVEQISTWGLGVYHALKRSKESLLNLDESVGKVRRPVDNGKRYIALASNEQLWEEFKPFRALALRVEPMSKAFPVGSIIEVCTSQYSWGVVCQPVVDGPKHGPFWYVEEGDPNVEQPRINFVGKYHMIAGHLHLKSHGIRDLRCALANLRRVEQEVRVYLYRPSSTVVQFLKVDGDFVRSKWGGLVRHVVACDVYQPYWDKLMSVFDKELLLGKPTVKPPGMDGLRYVKTRKLALEGQYYGGGFRRFFQSCVVTGSMDYVAGIQVSSYKVLKEVDSVLSSYTFPRVVPTIDNIRNKTYYCFANPDDNLNNTELKLFIEQINDRTQVGGDVLRKAMALCWEEGGTLVAADDDTTTLFCNPLHRGVIQVRVAGWTALFLSLVRFLSIGMSGKGIKSGAIKQAFDTFKYHFGSARGVVALEALERLGPTIKISEGF